MAKITPIPRHKIKFRHKPQFAVIVVCADEKAQQKAFNRLRRLGYKPRVVSV